VPSKLQEAPAHPERAVAHRSLLISSLVPGMDRDSPARRRPTSDRRSAHGAARHRVAEARLHPSRRSTTRAELNTPRGSDQPRQLTLSSRSPSRIRIRIRRMREPKARLSNESPRAKRLRRALTAPPAGLPPFPCRPLDSGPQAENGSQPGTCRSPESASLTRLAQSARDHCALDASEERLHEEREARGGNRPFQDRRHVVQR
jgi:hypothetical protein